MTETHGGGCLEHFNGRGGFTGLEQGPAAEFPPAARLIIKWGRYNNQPYPRRAEGEWGGKWSRTSPTVGAYVTMLGAQPTHG